MPRPLPPSLAESLPPQVERDPAEADEILRALGGVGLPGDQSLNRMDPNGNSPEADALSWEVANERHATTRTFFHGTLGDSLPVPTLGEFVNTGVNFAELRRAHEAYEQAGMKPELVFAPINVPLASWRDYYSDLRKWQDTNHPDSSFKLQKQDDGDGLYVWEAVAANWDGLSRQAVDSSSMGTSAIAPNGIVWKAAVIPTASAAEGGLAVNTSYNLVRQSDQFKAQTEAAGATPDMDVHMPLGMYLTLQAVHVLKEEALLDKDTWTWNAGTFNESGNLRAPASRWYPDDGQVNVNRDDVGLSDAYLGVRLPVWG